MLDGCIARVVGCAPSLEHLTDLVTKVHVDRQRFSPTWLPMTTFHGARQMPTPMLELRRVHDVDMFSVTF